MKDSIKKGLLFGLTSAIITTLGLMVGLYSGTASRLAVLGGILTIAVADAMSDALGIHISEEDSNDDHGQVWAATIATFLTKFFFALTFALPVIFFELDQAVIINIVWGIFVLVAINYKIALSKGQKPLALIFEHLSIASLVILLTYFVGRWISSTFV